MDPDVQERPRISERFVSIIVTVLNGEKWVDSCMESILQQEDDTVREISIFDDSSTDNTVQKLLEWTSRFMEKSIKLLITKNTSGCPRGVGFGRNRAIEASSGEFLCFLDIDDEMLPCRCSKQLEMARKHPRAIIGGRFLRDPEGSTERFTRWANELPQEKLRVQIYTSHGPTVVMPTWFFHRDVFLAVGGFSEAGKGTPEDSIFFLKHLDLGGEVFRLDDTVLRYRYHEGATTFSINWETIWNLRMKHLIENVLCKPPWNAGFTIWNAGKQGRRFYRDLPENFRKLIRCFCDVDLRKIGHPYQPYDPVTRTSGQEIPVIDFRQAQPPIVVCMKMDLTDGAFEENINSLNLTEGTDYILFS
ncbi:UDP-GlcNAc:betaGal beta-1,3-N-acetylglucosaminyltransferase-like protein 1 [Lutzomyia longipalpis]|uniref:UDP-GlcNAc:betaGal beta-1,3-N-acetylglucosaminyltransferase-like protein 1 n=1 Tax=Lutzomyia longipalpis TaxID=7200 RepID=UPI0024844B7F|nr:UDP-GlcNAc:betaGal beta-1,3-N-acetylglucosaminyltransferase-like protein 1 [Lutzomyia longipalpis]